MVQGAPASLRQRRVGDEEHVERSLELDELVLEGDLGVDFQPQLGEEVVDEGRLPEHRGVHVYAER